MDLRIAGSDCTAVYTEADEKLRGFIFHGCPQPFEMKVFVQYITG
jgi:hypothetical protein